MTGMRFLPVNRQAILVELADLQQTLVLLRLAGQPIEGVQELVPAARTILVQFARISSRRRSWCRRIAGRDLQRQRAALGRAGADSRAL
jgi:allophanate hydrolase subunit 1